MDAFVVGKRLSRKRLPPSRLFDELTNRKLRKKIKKKKPMYSYKYRKYIILN